MANVRGLLFSDIHIHIQVHLIWTAGNQAICDVAEKAGYLSRKLGEPLQ